MRIVVRSQPSPAAPADTQRLALSRPEADLVWRLREVPEGAVKDTLLRLLGDIASFVGHPACAESQADGVPCAVTRDCGECQRVDACLALLHETLHSR